MDQSTHIIGHADNSHLTSKTDLQKLQLSGKMYSKIKLNPHFDKNSTH